MALNWLFDPIVPERHDVCIPVHIGNEPNASSSVLHVWGHGVLGRPPTPLLLRQPHHSALLGCVIPQSPALRLLDPCIELGVTAPHSTMRALVVLQSISERDVSFRWHAGELDGEGASEGSIKFEPDTGVLYPGEMLGCAVTYQAGSEHQWLEGEVALAIAEGQEAGTAM